VQFSATHQNDPPRITRAELAIFADFIHHNAGSSSSSSSSSKISSSSIRQGKQKQEQEQERVYLRGKLEQELRTINDVDRGAAELQVLKAALPCWIDHILLICGLT